MPYNDNNIFAKILRGDIPCQKIDENDNALAFHDINPQAAVHALVIPKGAYISFADFSAQASVTEITDLMHLVRQVVERLGIEESGYRLLINNGSDAQQEVPHLHIHVLGGGALGPILSPRQTQ